MRIIAGTARGSEIFAPKGRQTRPTQDRVRESLFNILQAYTPEADVLDLFAGSGALALESLSRGAASAVMVDCASEAIAVIHRNVEKLGFGDRATILRCEWRAALERLAQQRKQLDLVFLDPPYRMTATPEYCACMADLGLLRDGAMMVIEHLAGEIPALDERFRLCNERSYGDTDIHFYLYQEG